MCSAASCRKRIRCFLQVEGDQRYALDAGIMIDGPQDADQGGRVDRLKYCCIFVLRGKIHQNLYI